MKRVLLFAGMFTIAATSVYAAPVVYINGKTIKEGRVVKVYQDELMRKKLIVSVKPAEAARGLEVSFDKGRKWYPMEPDEGMRGAFTYAHRIRKEGELKLSFLVEDRQGFSV